MDNASKSRIEVPKFSKSTFLSDVIFEEKKSNVHCPKNKLILLYIKKQSISQLEQMHLSCVYVQLSIYLAQKL